MTLPMLETFRLDFARVTLSIDSCISSEKGRRTTGVRYYPVVNEFITLRATVTNLTCRFKSSSQFTMLIYVLASPLVFTLDLETTPSEHLIYEGALTDLPLGRLEGGRSKEFHTSICFLASGHFEISAVVRAFGEAEVEGRVAKAHVTAVSSDSRPHT